MSDTPFPDWVVLKFGGTSVASRECWDAIAQRVVDVQAEGNRVLVVCSAVSGVTDALDRLPDADEPGAALSAIIDRHVALARDLGIESGDLLDEGRARLEAALRDVRDQPGAAALAQLLAQGEWLSTRLGQRFLECQVPCAWVDAREALTTIPFNRGWPDKTPLK